MNIRTVSKAMLGKPLGIGVVHQYHCEQSTELQSPERVSAMDTCYHMYLCVILMSVYAQYTDRTQRWVRS